MSIVNRVWDPTAVAFVSWKTSVPDVGGLFYPGPDTFSNTSDYRVARIIENEQSIILPGQHSLSAPLGMVQALWQMDGDMLDATANGIDLSGNATPLYAPAPTPGTKGAYIDNLASGDVWLSAAGATSDPLRLLGAITVECLVFPTLLSPDVYGRVVAFQNTGVGAINNTLWHLGLRMDNGVDNSFYYFHEFSTGGGGNVEIADSNVSVPLGQWSHLAFTRDVAGTRIRLYLNGLMVHREVVTNAPAGGANSQVQIGTDEFDSRRYNGSIASMRCTDVEFRPEHILASARATLPPSVRP